MGATAPSTLPKTETRQKPDLPWSVVILNDPVNLMSYVTLVLKKLFGYPEEKAVQLMLEVHHKGRSTVWSGARERAEFYVQQLQQHQLKSILEKPRPMKLDLIPPSSWGFSQLSEGELAILQAIPDATRTGGCPGAETRLYQPPLEDPETDQEGLVADWEEHVTPGFKKLFQSDVDTVIADLENIGETTDEEGETSYTLTVPAENAERWFSALNQARLVLAERNQLFREDGEEAIAIQWEDDIPTLIVDGSIDSPLPIETRIDALFRSQAYGFIQEWLIANLLGQ